MATTTTEDTAIQDEGLLSIRQFLAPLGSLKLTVALFACSLIIVLVGTLAQDEMNMLEVKQRYFLSWIAPLHIDDMFPQAFFPHSEPISLVVPFPGGALIGLLLMVNLVAAKTTRFKIHASGGKLSVGMAFMAAGAFVAGLIIMSGHNADGLQGEPPIPYDALWACVLAGTAMLAVALGYAGSQVSNRTIQSIAFATAASLGIFVVYALATSFRIGDPGLRIVWQLTKGLGAGVILLVGCMLLFEKQGGNVLLHLGVALLMFGQFLFGDRQLEQRLNLIEGQSSNTLANLDAVELAFITRAEKETEVISVPSSRLVAAAKSGTTIDDPSLPVAVKVLEYFPHSTLDDVKGKNLADSGVGLEVRAVERRKTGGADSQVNFASAYVQLIDRESEEPLGTFLVSQLISDRKTFFEDGSTENFYDELTIGDQDYELGLRCQRIVKPYWVQLEDVRQITYSGTTTPRDFSSYIRIVNPETGEDRLERVWMNNPLRYRGETFYQSNYAPLRNGKELTGIQVVRNSGWLIPYVACSITALGMLAHFLGTLTRFLKRRERETKAKREELEKFNITAPSNRPVIISLASVCLLAIYMLVPWTAVSNYMRPQSRMKSFDYYAAGKIPVQFGGRIMPLDSYARQTVKAMTSKESIPLDNAPSDLQKRVDTRKLSALQWLMEVASDQEEIRKLRMFRIDAEEVLSEFGLERRSTKLYSIDEISKNWDGFRELIEKAGDKDTADLSFKERKLIELDRRMQQFFLASTAFQLPFPEPVDMDEFRKIVPEATEEMVQRFQIGRLQRRLDMMRDRAAGLVAPTKQEAKNSVNDPRWAAFGPAFFDHGRSGVEDDKLAPPGLIPFSNMIQAYSEEKPDAFNEAVDAHLAAVTSYPIDGYDQELVGLERWMRANWPTTVATVLYLIALVLGLIYFMVNLPRLRTVVWGTLAIAMIVHTIAILCRISITGRAPVINLYSSAVFIGWASVLFGLVTERIFRYGAGNVLAAASGVLTLLVAYGLNEGDTMPVLRAVLDTQFWLATHVISVTLGYVATLVAGTLGIGYLVAGWIGKDKTFLRDIYRCCYGAACFGILFSFVGTVLGGLWADDSWGRFWGWDPKENGALLIVIWNALVLHARWDGMVAARGFASLAIIGNVVTAWSWFGTNELGIGLHSYGFTSGALYWLSIYVLSQLAFVVVDAAFRFVGLRFGSSDNSGKPEAIG